MDTRTLELGGLRALVVGDDAAKRVIVIMHGRMMEAADLVAFGHSLGVHARFVFPDGPIAAHPRGRAWWEVDSEARARAMANGGMDLHRLDPIDRAGARARLHALVEAVAPPDRELVLVGFSQGGMLAMDYTLHAERRPHALALLSSSRVAFDHWQPRLERLRGLPMLVVHGRDDEELAFAAGEGLRDAAIAGGADVTWVPFDGGHGLPLVVWRALRRWLSSCP